MSGGDFLYWLIMVIISIIVIWIVFSLIVQWAKPEFFKKCGSLNWWTTFWVVALAMLAVWVINVIVTCLIQWFKGPGDTCNSCQQPTGFRVNMWSSTTTY